MLRHCVILFCFLSLASCQYDPDSNVYVTSSPIDADLVGPYLFQRQYLNRAVTISRSPTIVLNGDHTYEVVDFPEWEQDGTSWKLSSTVASKGTWSVVTTGNLGDGSGGLKKVFGIQFDGTPPIRECNITLDGAERGLNFGYGDPDAGESMRYVRK